MKFTKTKTAAMTAFLALGASVWALPTSMFPGLAGHKTVANVPAVSSSAAIIGDYVEARTAAVFAGACHYNGELVTTGRDALMAWNFTSGTQDGVSLAGVRVMAAITSQENLSDAAAPHTARIVVDASASTQQVNAVVSLLKAQCGDALGTIVDVRRAPIAFARTDQGYSVSATDFGDMNVKYMPDSACCTQPGNVWYSPLSPIQGRKVGFTELASFTGDANAQWYRNEENSAFYGRFSF